MDAKPRKLTSEEQAFIERNIGFVCSRALKLNSRKRNALFDDLVQVGCLFLADLIIKYGLDQVSRYGWRCIGRMLDSVMKKHRFLSRVSVNINYGTYLEACAGRSPYPRKAIKPNAKIGMNDALGLVGAVGYRAGRSGRPLPQYRQDDERELNENRPVVRELLRESARSIPGKEGELSQTIVEERITVCSDHYRSRLKDIAGRFGCTTNKIENREHLILSMAERALTGGGKHSGAGKLGTYSAPARRMRKYATEKGLDSNQVSETLLDELACLDRKSVPIAYILVISGRLLAPDSFVVNSQELAELVGCKARASVCHLETRIVKRTIECLEKSGVAA